MHARSGPIGPAAEPTAAHGAPASGSLQRTAGVGRVRIVRGGVAELYQQGALRLRLPHANGRDRIDVVAINTAGGLTGGDRLELAVTVDAAAKGLVTTPAAEKIYRSPDGEAVVANALTVAPDGRLDWLPQPMILFDGARTHRSLVADVAEDGALLAVEGVILGRTAMNEEMRSGAVHDAWRIRRAGALVYADAFRAAGDLRGGLGGAATLSGARAFATVVAVAPEAERRLEEARNALRHASGHTGASAWNGILVVRFLAPDGQTLVSDVGAFLSEFRGEGLPRSWLC
jgi:urease accessory protein